VELLSKLSRNKDIPVLKENKYEYKWMNDSEP